MDSVKYELYHDTKLLIRTDNSLKINNYMQYNGIDYIFNGISYDIDISDNDYEEIVFTIEFNNDYKLFVSIGFKVEEQEINKMFITIKRKCDISEEKLQELINLEYQEYNDFNKVEFFKNIDDEEKENSYEIDYSLLKTMCDIINSCELYILNYIHRYETCFNSCFG